MMRGVRGRMRCRVSSVSRGVRCSGGLVRCFRSLVRGRRAGASLEIRGVGSHYNGPYYVTSATHHFGSNGYQTSFEARRNNAPGSGGAST